MGPKPGSEMFQIMQVLPGILDKLDPDITRVHAIVLDGEPS